MLKGYNEIKYGISLIIWIFSGALPRQDSDYEDNNLVGFEEELVTEVLFDMNT